MSAETWRPIPGYEGYYEVSNYGRVRSLTRRIIDKTNRAHTFYGKILADISDGSKWGYRHITLMKENKYKTIRVHRLVALAFIPNPLGLPIINHKDCDPRNNRADNLEWCTNEYNCNYTPSRIKRGHPVVQMNAEGIEISRYPTIADAGKAVGRYHSAICYAIKNNGFCAGYKWNYL